MSFLIHYAFAALMLIAAFIFRFIGRLFQTDSLGANVFGFFAIFCAMIAVAIFMWETAMLAFWVLSL